jgi:hypothetical protein
LLQDQLKRPATAHILGASGRRLVFDEPPGYVSRDPGIQAAICAPQHVHTVDSSAHRPAGDNIFERRGSNMLP